MADRQNSTVNGTVLADDIVTRLRAWADRLNPSVLILAEAADEIERLYSEINDLRLQIVALSLPQQAYRG